MFESSEGTGKMTNPPATSFSVLLCRLFWVFLGPAALFLTAVSIVQSGTGWLTGKDLLFGLSLLATVLCRWGDFWKGDRTNTFGDPVTEKYMWGYTAGALVAGVTLWVAANVLGNHVL